MVAKTTLDFLFQLELEALRSMENVSFIGPLIDVVEKPNMMILKYMDGQLLQVCDNGRTSDMEREVFARNFLEALNVIRSRGSTHAD